MSKQFEELTPTARRAWNAIETEFPSWAENLEVREGEMEFALPAPAGSKAGHLIALSHKDQLWVRFAPPSCCYPVDDEMELVSLIRMLIADEAVFKVVTKGDEWIETTLAMTSETSESEPGQTIKLVSWSAKHDRVNAME
jgi:hypothetical protein